jgi:Response regulator containing a CheY-like receiver domain and an HTH DNA-binding domain
MNTTSFPYEYMLQTLSSVAVELRSLQAQLSLAGSDSTSGDPAALLARIQDLQMLVSDALSVLRVDFAALDPSATVNETMRLDELLSHMVETTAEQLGLASRISFSGIDKQNSALETGLSPQARLLLYLVTREALHLVAHHPYAHHVRFFLHCDQTDVRLSLEDDGLPAPDTIPLDSTLPSAISSAIAMDSAVAVPPLPFFASTSTHVSTVETPAQHSTISDFQVMLADLRQRVMQLGGSLAILSADDGTRVQLRFPLAHTSPLAVVGDQFSTTAASTSTSTSVPAPSDTTVTSQTSPTLERAAPVRLLIAAGQAVLRAGLHRLLEGYSDFAVVGEAADGLQAVSETLELGPHVVLLDAQLADGQSLDTLRQIKQLNLNTKVLMLAVHEQEEYLYASLRAGADGYVLKDIAPDELAQAVRAVARGEVLIQPQLAGRLLTRYGRQGYRNTDYTALTAREYEVLQLLARGLRNKEIAARLTVSERTVHFHLANIYQKLQVSGRTEALRKALEQGLVTTS